MPAAQTFEAVRARVREHADGCWTLPMRPCNESGYVRVQVQGRRQVAHRVFWEALIEPLGARRIENVCGRHACVNPAHWRVEATRSKPLPACAAGHPWIRPLYRQRPGRRRERQCRWCKAVRERRARRTAKYRARHRRYQRERRRLLRS